jgi:hypothetical protein
VLTVDDSDVDIPEDADGFLDSHDEWSAQVDAHKLTEAYPDVVARPPSLVFRLLPLALGQLL